jgi:1-hydroxycarotenoid 3,4-desaturase
MLVAYVEQSGVWYVEGGMHRLAASLADLAQGLGARIRYGSEVAKIHLRSGRPDAVELTGGERVPVDCIVSNADNNALNAGLFGAEVRDCVPGTPLRARSLSALTWNLVAHTEGFELARHSVFFSADYRAEFDDIFKLRRLPRQPTVYICAQDRFDGAGDAALESERLLCLVNAPATGDIHDFAEAEIERCATTMYELLARCGLRVECPAAASQATSPADFNRLFPSTGGALYGPASHGWMTSFTRPGSRSAVPGLYLAGGSTHPGPGVPMAAISGRLAAASLAADYASIARFRSVAMPGGISTR